MPNDIKSILTANDNVKFATDVGTRMHARLGRIVIDADKTSGDTDLIEKINSVPGLSRMFSAQSQVEVPIAGTIAHRFVSRRIDRLLVDTEQRVVYVLDYKTDTNHADVQVPPESVTVPVHWSKGAYSIAYSILQYNPLQFSYFHLKPSSLHDNLLPYGIWINH